MFLWLEMTRHFSEFVSLIWLGSYEIFVDEKSAQDAFEANAANNRPFTDEAEEVDAQPAEKDGPVDGEGAGGGGDGPGPNGPGVPNARDVKEDSLMESQVRHHRGRHHRKHAKGRWRS